MKRAKNARFVAVKSYGNRFEAEIGKSLLDANGIEAFVSADDAGGLYLPFQGGAKLLVPSKQVEKARKILGND
jgi:hypothetical protein